MTHWHHAPDGHTVLLLNPFFFRQFGIELWYEWIEDDWPTSFYFYLILSLFVCHSSITIASARCRSHTSSLRSCFIHWTPFYYLHEASMMEKRAPSFSRCLFLGLLLSSWLCYLHGMHVTKTTAPPLLDVPTYSLATVSVDGRTAMNILTYATPVSATPERIWALSLFKGLCMYLWTHALQCR